MTQSQAGSRAGPFLKGHLDALYGDLNGAWKGTDEYEQLLRDAHLGIALHDAGQPLLGRIDERIAALIDRHKPGA